MPTVRKQIVYLLAILSALQIHAQEIMLPLVVDPLKGELLDTAVWDFSQQWSGDDRSGTSVHVYGDSLLAETVAGRRYWYCISGDSIFYNGEEDRLTTIIVDSPVYMTTRPFVPGYSSGGIARIRYDRLDKPVEVTFNDGHRQTVSYDGFGRKIRVDYAQGPATVIGGDLPADGDYEVTLSRVYARAHMFCDGRLEYSGFPSGYFDASGSPRYYITDWQGNNVAVVDKAGSVVQKTTYYPYGEPTIGPEGQRYLFGGKEREHAGGRNSYDFGARSLTPYARWSTPDPLAEKFYPISPYSYCGGDPINGVDRDGEFWETLWDVGNVVYDVGAAIYNHAIGDHKKAREHWVDAAYDTGAALIPFVPAGASKGAKAGAEIIKALDKTSDAGKAAGRAVGTGVSAKNTKGSASIIAPNDGIAKPHGGKEHNERIDKMVEVLKKDGGVKHIRKNQKQVDVDGNTVGNNRPDIQFDKDGVHTNIEYDTKSSSMKNIKRQ